MSLEHPELGKAREISALDERATIDDAIKLALEGDNKISRGEMGSLYAKFQGERQELDDRLRSMRSQISEQAQKQWSRLWKEIEASAASEAAPAEPVVEEVPVKSAAEAPAAESAAEAPAAESAAEAPAAAPLNRFDLSEVTHEFVESLKGTEHEVNVNSKLNVRDQNGKIIGSMKKLDKVTLTGNKKVLNNVTFVEIDKDKYVSLQYLKPLVKTDVPLEQQQVTPQEGDVDVSSIISSSDESAPINPSDTIQQTGLETAKVDLSKGVNIVGENGYIGFKNMSGISNLPDWKDLPTEIINDKTGKLLSMSVKDGKVNVYFGEKRVNQDQNQYTGETSYIQEYVMKYGEIVDGKFEKTPIGGMFSFDDLGNNITSQ